MKKKIEVNKRSTFYSVKIWDKPDQEYPRVRIASIDKATGRAPHLNTILREEEDVCPRRNESPARWWLNIGK